MKHEKSSCPTYFFLGYPDDTLGGLWLIYNTSKLQIEEYIGFFVEPIRQALNA